ncbi:DUF4232 domain-containing protein [Arthrobacter sp. 35W]|uniref:DUF4232 domain-containing protein n=1 Tax=Arthrobacter sp. 35W TaxID=1132441 RepID=UPI001E5CDC41|nr:DUF4232 domain-containing protein [Arthrobacter sp. 35W]
MNTTGPAMGATARRGLSRKLIIAALPAAALALALTACGGGQTPASTTTTADSSPSEQTTSASPTATATPSTAPSTSAAAALCTAAMLSGSVDDSGGGAAGSIYMKLIVKNTTDKVCILDGYPGVSLVGDGNGTQIGAAADRDPAAPSSGPITLEPGASAAGVLRYTQAGNYQNCERVEADGLRVYPPSATDALYIAHPLTACSNEDIKLLTIGAFQP